MPLLRRVVLLVLNELRDAPHNEYLRLFASRQRVRASAIRRVDHDASAAIWSVIFALQKAYELEGAGMSNEVTVESLLALGEEMRKQVVASASVEERLAGLKPEERLAGLEPEQRLASLELADLRMLLKQIEAYLQAQAPGAQSPDGE